MDTFSQEIARYATALHQAWVWLLPLANFRAGARPALNVVLGGDERNRAAAFHFEKDALSYAAAHALPRWGLSVRYGRATGISPAMPWANHHWPRVWLVWLEARFAFP